MPPFKNLILEKGQVFIWKYDGKFSVCKILEKLSNDDGYVYTEISGYKFSDKIFACTYCSECNLIRKTHKYNGSIKLKDSPKCIRVKRKNSISRVRKIKMSTFETTFIMLNHNNKEIRKYRWFIYNFYLLKSILFGNK